MLSMHIMFFIYHFPLLVIQKGKRSNANKACLNVRCFVAIADERDFLSFYIASFAVNLGSFDKKRFVKLMKDEIEFAKNFHERNIYVFLFNLRHVIHVPPFRFKPF